MLQFTTLYIQIVPPPPSGPPGPPGLPIDNGILILLTAAIMYGSYAVMSRNLDNDKLTYWDLFSVDIKFVSKKYWNKCKKFLRRLKLMSITRILFVVILLVSVGKVTAQSDTNTIFDTDSLATNNIFLKDNLRPNTWAIRGGLSNIIIHGDLRPIETSRIFFWNFRGYLKAKLYSQANFFFETDRVFIKARSYNHLERHNQIS